MAHVSRICHSGAWWDSQGQTALKGNSSLGYFIATEFVLSMDRRYWVQVSWGTPSRQDLNIRNLLI